MYKRQIFASHSNARSVCQHRRSLLDRHIREIAQCGGVICVNFYPPQLSQFPSNACAQDVARQDVYKRQVLLTIISGVDYVVKNKDAVRFD